jgi:hypothetical protein
MVTRSTPDYRSARPVSRRQFGMTTGAAVVGAGLVGMALMDQPKALTTVGNPVQLGDPASPITAFFVRPTGGAYPGVLTWRSGDVMTEDERDEARELSEKGYAVLVLDRKGGSAQAAANDVHQATWWLKQQQQVDKLAGIGTPEWALLRLEPVKRV